ncbi:hypothetical protein [Undibacterium sp. Ji49W]|uniref:hypothetical protein n=1 Tax=Undibacterium sp. Ji49W TaxID=3413040 RepID=UPI003BF0C2E1
MEQNNVDLTQEHDPIAEKLRDTHALTKVVQQAVRDAVDKAQRLGFLPSTKSWS